MKKFIILNGDSLYIRQYETHEQALIFAQNYMNHSKPIIVREINELDINLNK